MNKKQEAFVIKGISQDLNQATKNNEYAFSALNIRISVNKDNSLLAITNEKGTDIVPVSNPEYLNGKVVGVFNLDNYVVLFVKGDKDLIVRLNRDGNTLNSVLLFEGTLNLSDDVECIGLVESELNYNVYWIDGINQLRKINLKYKERLREEGKAVYTYSDDDLTKINSISDLDYTEEVTVTPTLDGNSLFQSGVVQYAFSYFNYGDKETPIFYISPIYYLTSPNRSLNADERSQVGFTVQVSNLSKKYSHLRVYSIVRSSINATPTVSIVKDIAITTDKAVLYDSNFNVSNIDKDSLLYSDLGNIIPKTFTHKDNTLFLGNYKYLGNEEVTATNIVAKSEIGERSIGDKYLLFEHNRNEIAYFKKGEEYPLGVVLRKRDGTISNVVYLGNCVSNYSYVNRDGKTYLSDLVVSADIDSKEYIQAIPVRVNRLPNMRRSIVQGFLNPTVYTQKDRLTNSPYSYSSWFIRPSINTKEREYTSKDRPEAYYNDELPIGNVEFRDGYFLPSPMSLNAEMPTTKMWGYFGYPRSVYDQNGDLFKDDFIIDRQTVSLYSKSLASQSITIEGHTTIELIGILPIVKNDFAFDMSLTAHSLIYNDGTLNGYTKQYNRDNTLNALIAGPLYQYNVDGQKQMHIEDDISLKSIVKNHKEHKDDRTSFFTNDTDNSYKNLNTSLLAENFIIYPFHHSSFITGNAGAKITKKTLTNVRNAGSPIKFDDTIVTNAISSMVYPENKGYSIIDDSGDVVTNRMIRAYVDVINIYRDPINFFKFEEGGYPIVSARYGFDTYDDGRPNDSMIRAMYLTPESKYAYELLMSKREYYDMFKEYFKGDTTFEHFKEFWIYRHYYSYGLDSNIPFSDYSKFDFFSKEPLDAYCSTKISHKDTAKSNNLNTTNAGVGITYKNEKHLMLKLTEGVLPSKVYMDHNNILTTDDYTFLYLAKYEDKEGRLDYLLKSFPKQFNKSLNLMYLNNKDILNNPDRLAGYTSNIDITTRLPYRANMNNKVIGIHTTTKDDYSAYTNLPYLLLAEVINLNYYKVDANNASEFDFIIAGEPTLIKDGKINLRYTLGDYFIDNSSMVVTKELNSSSLNNIVEVISFPEEVSFNPYSRTDKQQLFTTAEDISSSEPKFNMVYNQEPNYKVYKKLDKVNTLVDDYPSSLVWSLTKSYNDPTDKWMSITGTSNYDLNGSLGAINKLITFNDNIITFQDRGIANIIFNPRVQIATSDDVPIEISNSNKVEGHRYVSDIIGCQNKHTVATTKYGIYFIDSNTNTIHLYSNGVESLSDKFGIRHTIESKLAEYSNFVTNYDVANSRVFFTLGNEVLGYNEITQSFESFYSYTNMRYMFNIGDSTYSLQKGSSKVWKHYTNNTGMYYGMSKEWSITYKVSPNNGITDKTFTNFSVRADSYKEGILQDNIDLNRITATTEYQNYSSKLEYYKYTPSSLKKKFRLWNGDIPRLGLKRIRNPWANVTFYSSNTMDTILYNTTITYYE